MVDIYPGLGIRIEQTHSLTVGQPQFQARDESLAPGIHSGQGERGGSRHVIPILIRSSLGFGTRKGRCFSTFVGSHHQTKTGDVAGSEPERGRHEDWAPGVELQVAHINQCQELPQ